ncbi:MAG TPA: hypothetical protein VI603_10615 [Saprospiraceae bacterium]|nr:hypothetical protein [Saprospiraceae bacterium]
MQPIAEQKPISWLTGSRLLLLFFLFACLVFGPLYNAGFVTDFLGWLECRDTTPFWRAYECFGNRGLYFIPFIILGFLTGGFGLHPLPWFLVWIGLHAINAWLVADICRRLFSTFQVSFHWTVPLLAGLIFLLHPWQVEVLAWKACSNYLTSCLLMLLTLRSYLQYIVTINTKYYWISVGTYFLFLFTLEFALLFPALIAMLLWCLSTPTTFVRRSVGILMELMPYLIAIGLWFIANKLLFGLWIGHYGAEAHTAIDIIAMSSVVFKYLVKTLLFARFLSFPIQTELYGILDTVVVGGFMLGIFVGLGILMFRIHRRTLLTRLRIFLFLSAIVFIIPVTNLYFYYLQFSENDRYTYLAIAFLSIGLISLLWNWRGWPGKGILALYLVACFWGTIVHVRIWEKSTTAYWHHIRTFPEPQKPKVFLLNVPDNYRGTFMFRNIGGDSSFDEVYKWIAKSDYSGKMYDVFQYNMTDLTNDFIVTRESGNKIKIEFAQWGNWWWRNGRGAEKYSNKEYTAWPEGKYYYVEFKKPLEDAVILYYTPQGWKEVPKSEIENPK